MKNVSDAKIIIPDNFHDILISFRPTSSSLITREERGQKKHHNNFRSILNTPAGDKHILKHQASANDPV